MVATAAIPADDHLHLADVRRRIKAIFIGSVGNLVEWYDFYAYAAFALYFAGSFFPGDDPVVQQLNAAVLFAVRLHRAADRRLAVRPPRRPLRAAQRADAVRAADVLRLADDRRHADLCARSASRRRCCSASRACIQGLSLGGEYGTSATYLTEVADEKHRGFYSSFQYVTLIGGQLCAILVLLLLQQVFLTADQLKAWGWRIPFVIGALLAIIALVMRRNLHETDDFIAAKKVARKESSVRALLKYPREVLLVVGLTMGGTTAFYTYTTYMQKFLKLSVGLTDSQTTLVTAGSLIFALFLQPIYGALSDRIGRKPLLIWFGVMGTLCTIPLLTRCRPPRARWSRSC